MSDYGASIGRGERAAEAALWACAGLVMLAAHVGGAAWLMRERPAMAADNEPPAAIMIELAPEPEAVFTEANEVAPDQETAVASAPAEEVPTEEKTPPEELVQEITEAEPEPVEEVTGLKAEELEPVEEEPDPAEQELAMIPDAEVPLPVFRPKPPVPKKEIIKEQPKKQEKKPEARKPVRQRQQQQAASKEAMQAKALTTQSNRNAGRQTAAGVSSMSPAKWQSRLMAHLERRKRYPSGARSRGERGTVYVRFRIDDAGNVLSVALAGSSGFSELDNEVLSLVRRASPVPAPPPGVNKNIMAPVRFSTR